MMRSSFAFVLLLATCPTGASGQAWPPPIIDARVQMRFSDTRVIQEPIHMVVVPDNGPAPQPRAEVVVQVLAETGDPYPGVNVFVVFSAAATPSLCWCAAQNQETSVLADGSRVFRALTDAGGTALFQISAGGCLEASGAVSLKAGAPGDSNPNDAIPFRLYAVVSSMDNAGPAGAPCDRTVNVIDLVHYAGAHLGGGPLTCHDYNGDGAVNSSDLVLYGQHHLRGASCP